MRIDVIIPAHNEMASIGHVINDLPELVRDIVVVDNASTDDTTKAAQQAGATVLFESRKGYGYACLKGIGYLNDKAQPPDIVVFLDGDYSDYPEELPLVIQPILESGYDLVIGARMKGMRESGAMTPQQAFGNWLATALMRLFFGSTFTDLGPFRAIRLKTLNQLRMQDKTYGWTVEMQLKTLKQGLRYTEVPVRYRKRIGVSKVSGTVKGTIFAGVKILGWIFKYSLKS